MRTSIRQHPLSAPFRFTLFVTSYTPLFALLAFNQFTRNSNLLHWGGISIAALKIWFSNFFLATLASALIIYGLLSLLMFLRVLDSRTARNGNDIKLLEIRNKNSEAISYLGSYIIPFLFQQYSSLYEGVATVILILIIYQIYVHSTLMMINPLLTMFYSLYEIDLQDVPGTKKTGMVIIRDRYLETTDRIRVYPIGPRLYFGQLVNV